MRITSFYRVFLFALAIISPLFFAGCGGGGGGGGGGGSHAGTPGALSFIDQHQPTIALATAPAGQTLRTSVAVANPADFEEGNLPATTTYLFELRNTGGTAITNVVLKATNSNPNGPDYSLIPNPPVIVTPVNIGVLQPVGVASFAQIIQVTVIHGRNASGVGTAAQLPAGRFTFGISAVGDSAGATATIGLTAQVANFTCTLAGQPVIDQFSTVGAACSAVTPSGNYSLPIFGGYADTQPLVGQSVSGVFTNTGNVPISLTQYTNTQNGGPFGGQISLWPSASATVVQPGATAPVSAVVDSTGHVDLYLSADPGGAITSDTLAPGQADGNWWGVLHINPGTWN